MFFRYKRLVQVLVVGHSRCLRMVFGDWRSNRSCENSQTNLSKSGWNYSVEEGIKDLMAGALCYNLVESRSTGDEKSRGQNWLSKFWPNSQMVKSTPGCVQKWDHWESFEPSRCGKSKSGGNSG